MPPNIFATTGTNVSVVFIDKDGADKITLVDAKDLGEKIKEGKNQRTILSLEEERQIVEAFDSDEDVEDFSVHPTTNEIKKKNYSLSAGQYFEIKIKYTDISEEEFNKRIADFSNELENLLVESNEIGQTIKESLKKVKYEQ